MSICQQQQQQGCYCLPIVAALATQWVVSYTTRAYSAITVPDQGFAKVQHQDSKYLANRSTHTVTQVERRLMGVAKAMTHFV